VDGDFEALPVVSHLTVKDFRPETAETKKKVLFADDEHVSRLLYFLTRKEVTREEMWQFNCTSRERKERLNYLNRVLKILPAIGGPDGISKLIRTYGTFTLTLRSRERLWYSATATAAVMPCSNAKKGSGS
jgi:hypothetical protein